MTVEFSYRPDNLRLKRTKGTIVNYLIWDGGQIVAELNGTGVLTDCYAYELERIKSKGIRYFIHNGQGDVVHYANDNGKIMTSYSYDGEYGNVTGGNSNNPFRYRGEYYDTDLKLYYLRARWYDSALGEFISEDPVKDGVNWYVYCSNNPVKFRDSSGLKAGDKFEKLNDAAKDFGNTTNSKSIEEDVEYGTYFYSWTENIEESYWFFGLHTKTVTKTFYSYTQPHTDNDIMNVQFEIDIKKVPIPKGTLTALGHTHGAWKESIDGVVTYFNDAFSKDDIAANGVSKALGVPMFLATPNGSIKKMDPDYGLFSKKFVTTVSKEWKVPHDNNHPDKPWYYSRNCQNCCETR